MAKVIKRYNLTVVTRKYTDQQGQEKPVWRTIGEMTVFQREDGSTSTMAELYHMPGVTVSVFPVTEKPAAPAQASAPATTGFSDNPPAGEEIKVENLPF